MRYNVEKEVPCKTLTKALPGADNNGDAGDDGDADVLSK
jgi:hypothetical protein